MLKQNISSQTCLNCYKRTEFKKSSKNNHIKQFCDKMCSINYHGKIKRHTEKENEFYSMHILGDYDFAVETNTETRIYQKEAYSIVMKVAANIGTFVKRKYFFAYFSSNKTIDEIAKDYHVSRGCVWQAIQTIVYKIKRNSRLIAVLKYGTDEDESFHINGI